MIWLIVFDDFFVYFYASIIGNLKPSANIHIIWFWKDIYRPCIQWVLYSKNEKPMKRLFFHIFHNKEFCRRGNSRTRKIYNHLKLNIFSIHTLFNKIFKNFKRSFFLTISGAPNGDYTHISLGVITLHFHFSYFYISCWVHT